MDEDLKLLLKTVLITLVSIVVVMVGIFRGIVHPLDVADCRAFSEASGYTTKFADYTLFSWDCLVETENGKWVSRSNLQGVNQ